MTNNTDIKYHKRIKKFNTIFTEFLNELGYMYPSDYKLKLLIYTVSGMVAYDPETLALTVASQLMPYYDRIKSRDELFFIDDLSKDFEPGSLVSGEIERIKIIWANPDTTSDTKDCIWVYFNKFIDIGNKLKV